MRKSERGPKQIRDVVCEMGYVKNTPGSCLLSAGDTKVLCTASIEENVPRFLRNSGKGWLTAEYSMLPGATNHRSQRESSRGKLSGRTHEIQRLIARSLRSAIDLNAICEMQIHIDCDVINADGGTRCASITAGYMALYQCVKNMYDKGMVSTFPIISQIAAISCGIVDGTVMLDLDYPEDSNADVDSNFVMNTQGNFIEIQSTSEKEAMTKAQFLEMMDTAQSGISDLFKIQNKALGTH